MDLFELLFVGMIIVFSILEGVMRKRKGSGPTAPGPGPGPGRMESESGGVGPGPSDREPVKAADMVPDDLWAVLTGEHRPTDGVEAADEGDSALEQTGRLEETPRTEPGAATVPDRWEDAWTPRPEPSWRLEEEEPAPEPVAPGPYGPEAYSLERLDQEATSLESPLQSSAARHRRFHERIEPTRRAPRPRRAGVGKALRTPASLRRAFVLTEVLGTPKGLE